MSTIPNGNPQALSTHPLVQRLTSMLKARNILATPVNAVHNEPSWQVTEKGSSYAIPAGVLEDTYVRVEKIDFIARCEFVEIGSICTDEVTVSYKPKSPTVSHFACQSSYYTRGSSPLDGSVFWNSCYEAKGKEPIMQTHAGSRASVLLRLMEHSIHCLLGMESPVFISTRFDKDFSVKDGSGKVASIEGERIVGNYNDKPHLLATRSAIKAATGVAIPIVIRDMPAQWYFLGRETGILTSMEFTIP